MSRFFALLIATLSCLPAFCQQPLVFEAEDYSTPADAWTRDRLQPDKWNLGSQDSDAARKWSGGQVLQTAPFSIDRETPEEGP